MVSRSVLKLDKGKNADCLVTIIPEQQHAFLHSNIEDSTFHHPPGADNSPLSLQRGKYVISFCCSLFKQSGINYPPTSSVPLSFKKGASFLMLSFSQLSYSYVFVKWKKCNILPSFLLIHIVDSTFQRRSSVPLSLQRGKLSHASVNQLLHSCPLQEEDIWYPGPY